MYRPPASTGVICMFSLFKEKPRWVTEILLGSILNNLIRSFRVFSEIQITWSARFTAANLSLEV